MKRASTSSQTDSYSLNTCSKKCKELESLKYLLDCSICLNRIRPMSDDGAVFTCFNSHFVCTDCQIELKHQSGADHYECPICRIRVRGRGVRNLFASAYLDVEYRNTAMDCKYPGCSETGYLTESVIHENFCQHRRVCCPAGYSKSCNWRGPVNELAAHIKASNCCRMVMDHTKRSSADAD